MKKQSTPTCAPNMAVAYARYSSAGQRDVSIEQQLHDIREYAKREGLTIVHEYADHARSGFRHIEQREEFQRMLNAARAGKFAAVIVWKTDRFARSREDAAIYKGHLKRAGVRVISAMEPIPEGSAGILLEGMLEATAEWYSRTLSENVTRGMTDNANRCLYNGTRVLGYCKGPDGRYAINEEEAAIVRQIFARYREGYSAAMISRDLNRQGLKTSRGVSWTPDTVIRTVNNERYAGTYIWGAVRIEDGIPAIISKAEFKEAQRMKKKTSRHVEQGAVEFILTGRAYCGECGAAMIGDSGTSKTGTRHYYYTCQAHKARKGCTKKAVPKDFLETVVLDCVLDNVLRDPEIERIADALMAEQEKRRADSPLPALKAELKEVTDQIDAINDAIAHRIWSNTTVDRLKDLEGRADALREHIGAMEYSEKQMLDRDRVLFHLHRFQRGDRNDPAFVAHILTSFVNAIYVFDDHLKLVVNAVESDHRISLEDLPTDLECSDSDVNGVLLTTHPNSVIYTITLPDKKRA